MSFDQQHIAFPRLFGAPAYARPPAPVEVGVRPFDPDELPIVAEQTPEERAATEALLGSLAFGLVGSVGSIGSAGTSAAPQAPDQSLAPHPFSLKRLTDLLHHRSD